MLAPFRRRLVQVPFQLHFPLWMEDPDFDLDNHIHRAALPAPGGARELAELVGDLASRPLDRNRPLWEMWIVEGLEDGLVAMFSKMHHSTIDGAAGAELMMHLFDLTPTGEGEHAEVSEEWHPEQKPSDLELVGHALVARAEQPLALAKLLVKSARSITGLVGDMVSGSSAMSGAARPFAAPRTPFNGAITPHRSAAFGRTSLEDMRLIKRAFGSTVNDVVLTATAASLRSWLAAHGGIPDKALVASVPISVRVSGDESLGNRVSAMFAALPVEIADPVERLLAVAESTKGAKEVHGALGADMLGDWAEFAIPSVFGRAVRFYSERHLADRHPPIHNLVVSNVPGPPIPLYIAGGRVVAVYPMGPILEGAGLNVTVISFMGSIDFSAIACRELVPDVADIANGFVEAVAELKKLAEAKSAKPVSRRRPPP